MLFSLLHPGIGSSSQYKLFSFERVRLIQSLFGYHHLTSSLMEPLPLRPPEGVFGEAISSLTLRLLRRVSNALLAVTFTDL